MIKSRRQMRIIVGSISVLMLVVIIGIVYSAFTGQLNINGTGTVRNSSWDIHIVESGELDPSNSISSSVKVLSKPTATETTISNYSVSLTTPGDSISYIFNVINEGEYNAKISSITIPTPECTGTDTTSNNNVCSKLSYSLKYVSGASVSTNDTLLSKETKTMVLTLTYQDFSDASLLPTSDVTISNLGIEINYAQVDSAIVNNEDGTTPKVYDTYDVGTEKTINGELYYVINDGGTSKSYVTLLKANPLTVDEVNRYGAGHVNRYTYDSVGTAYNYNGYGEIAYYSSEMCGYVNSSIVYADCKTDYNQSEVKYVVDAWARAKFTNDELATDINGYQARLITREELEGLGYGSITGYKPANSEVPTWVYNSNYWYWTMSQRNNSSSVHVWSVDYNGYVSCNLVNYSNRGAVRPVINVYKSVLN